MRNATLVWDLPDCGADQPLTPQPTMVCVRDLSVEKRQRLWAYLKRNEPALATLLRDDLFIAELRVRFDAMPCFPLELIERVCNEP